MQSKGSRRLWLWLAGVALVAAGAAWFLYGSPRIGTATKVVSMPAMTMPMSSSAPLAAPSQEADFDADRRLDDLAVLKMQPVEITTS